MSGSKSAPSYMRPNRHKQTYTNCSQSGKESYSHAVVAFTHCVNVCVFVCVFYESVFTLWLLLMPFRLPAAHEGIIMGQRWLRLALWHTHTHIHRHGRTSTHTCSLSPTYTYTGLLCASKSRHADRGVPRALNIPFCLSLIQTHTHRDQSSIKSLCVVSVHNIIILCYLIMGSCGELDITPWSIAQRLN